MEGKAPFQTDISGLSQLPYARLIVIVPYSAAFAITRSTRAIFCMFSRSNRTAKRRVFELMVQERSILNYTVAIDRVEANTALVGFEIVLAYLHKLTSHIFLARPISHAIQIPIGNHFPWSRLP